MTAMRIILATVIATILALPLGAQAQGNTTVSGRVTYNDRRALPANAVVTVQLTDVSRAGAPAQVIAEQVIPANGAQVPISFSLAYDAARINAGGLYSIQANIKIDGVLRYTSTTQALVITAGRPVSNVQVNLAAVPNLPAGTAGLLLPLAALALLGAAGALYVVRRRV